MHFKGVVLPHGKKFDLKDCRTSFSGQKPKNIEGLLAEVAAKIKKLHDMLHAQKKYGVLIDLQGIDTAGKDGVVKALLSGLDPAAADVHSFKAPNKDEVLHDFIWRSARVLPARGELVIFNRSYYEETTAPRVHPEYLAFQNLPDEAMNGIWENRFKHICNWEEYLTDNGIIVLKFFLILSKSEQRKRLLKRVDTPSKNWKFSEADIHERGFWDENLKAWSHTIAATSTSHAPWNIIPADDKDRARLAVSEIVLARLEKLPLKYPHLDHKEHQEALVALKAKLEGEDGQKEKKDREGQKSTAKEDKKKEKGKKGKKK